VASAFPGIGPYKLEICVGVVLLMCFGNLRGLKEAGRAFAVPTYLFAGSVILMIVVGVIREMFGHLPLYDPTTMHGAYTLGPGTEGIISGVMIFTLLRAFAKARSLGLTTIGLAGGDGGAMARAPEIDRCLVVRTDSIHHVQETHVAIYHILWDLVHTLLAADRGQRDAAP